MDRKRDTNNLQATTAQTQGNLAPVEVLAETDYESSQLTVRPLHQGRVAVIDPKGTHVRGFNNENILIPDCKDVRPLSSDGRFVWLRSDGKLASGRLDESGSSVKLDSTVSLDGYVVPKEALASMINSSPQFKSLMEQFGMIQQNPEKLLDREFMRNFQLKHVNAAVDQADKLGKQVNSSPEFLSTSAQGDGVAVVLGRSIIQMNVGEDGNFENIKETEIKGEILAIKARTHDVISVVREESGRVVMYSTAQESELLKIECFQDNWDDHIGYGEQLFLDEALIEFSGTGNRMAIAARNINRDYRLMYYTIPTNVGGEKVSRGVEGMCKELDNENIDSMALNDDGSRLIVSMREDHELRRFAFGPLGHKTAEWSTDSQAFIATMAFASDGALFIAKDSWEADDSEKTEIIRISDN